MFKMFGGKGGKDKAPSTGEAIQKLRDTEDMLQKKSDFLEKKLEALQFAYCGVRKITMTISKKFCFYQNYVRMLALIILLK